MAGRYLVAAILVSLLSWAPAFCQTAALKNATAVSLLSSAVKTLSQGVPISSVTLTASVTRTAGSDVETGSATLEALGGVDGSINLSLTNGQRSEIISQSQEVPAGQWMGSNGTLHAMAQQNCWIPVNWFFPALALAEAINSPSTTVSYVGQETLDNEAVKHIRFWRVSLDESASSSELAILESLSRADVFLDAANNLPIELDFNLHPDKNASVNIPVEIRYGGYQQVSGILLPTHIQKLINHSVVLDLNVTGAIINSNLSSADFAITATTATPQ